MDTVIQLLPNHVANQIAAGEVVQRPASVVKELLENAIDAKATQIDVIVHSAGKQSIKVIDNGVGMGSKDALLCFERHATSKITKATDLFSLNTKGFRGEALASIAAVSQVSLETKRVIDELGVRIKIEAGQLKLEEPCVCSQGTSLQVSNLFYNIPARRNFLKSSTIELRHIIEEFYRVALVHHDIGFSFWHDRQQLYSVKPNTLRKRIVQLIGNKINEQLVPIEEQTPLIKISGFVGKPLYAKKNKSEQYFFVNNRFIRSTTLHQTIMSAFEGLLKEKVQPSYFVFIEVDPKSLDVNIHPTKTEVKFEDDQLVHTILKSCVKHSLGQFSIASTFEFQEVSQQVSQQLPYEYSKKELVSPTIAVNENFNPFQTGKNIKLFNENKAVFTKVKDQKDQKNYKLSENQKNLVDVEVAQNSILGYTDSSTNPEQSRAKITHDLYETLAKEVHDYQPKKLSSSESSTAVDSPFSEFTQIGQSANSVTPSLFSREYAKTYHKDHNNTDADQTITATPYQFKRKYIITGTSSSLLLIHQHRAHLRILYDQFSKEMKSSENTTSQQLLFPLEIELSKPDLMVLKSVSDTLVKMGFVIDGFLDQKICFTGLPIAVPETQVTEILEQLIIDLHQVVTQNVDLKLKNDRLLLSLASSLAVKTGTSLHKKEMLEIINTLFACENPAFTPDGRNITSSIPVSQIDSRFY